MNGPTAPGERRQWSRSPSSRSSWPRPPPSAPTAPPSTAGSSAATLVDPGAYVVDGFKNEMPNPQAPPISLSPDEVRAVVLYLQTLGGSADAAAIRLPATALARAARGAPAERPLLAGGDPARGRTIFFDYRGSAACGRCHRVRDAGGTVGPELTHIAGTRDAAFILESILEPARTIASGYETWLVEMRGGQIVTGIARAT